MSPTTSRPRAEGPKLIYTNEDYGNLYIFQHGCKTSGGKVDGMQSGTNLIETGWVHGQQETLVIGDGPDGLQTAPSFSTVNEVEPPHHGQTFILKAPTGRECSWPTTSAWSRTRE